MKVVVKRLALTLLSLSLPAPCIAQLADYDRIQIEAGGLMTPGLDVKINLNTGEIIRRSQRFFGDAASQDWTEARHVLGPAALAHLLSVIEANLAKNWETDECLQQDRLAQAARDRGELPVPPMPAMDGWSSLYMRFRGKSYYSPAEGCRTQAFYAVWSEVGNVSDPAATGSDANGS